MPNRYVYVYTDIINFLLHQETFKMKQQVLKYSDVNALSGIPTFPQADYHLTNY